MAHAVPRGTSLRLRNGGRTPQLAVGALAARDRPLSAVEPPTPSHYVLALDDDAVLGDALGALAAAGVDVLTCHRGALRDRAGVPLDRRGPA